MRPDDDQARRDTDPASQRHLGTASQRPDRGTQFEGCADRLLGVVFVRHWVAEQDERAVSDIPE